MFEIICIFSSHYNSEIKFGLDRVGGWGSGGTTSPPLQTVNMQAYTRPGCGFPPPPPRPFTTGYRNAGGRGEGEGGRGWGAGDWLEKSLCEELAGGGGGGKLNDSLCIFCFCLEDTHLFS